MLIAEHNLFLLLKIPNQDLSNVISIKALFRQAKRIKLIENKCKHVLPQIYLQPTDSIPLPDFSRKIKINTGKYYQYLDQQVVPSNRSHYANRKKKLLDSFNAQDSFQIYCKKRQPKIIEIHYDCKEEVKTDECNVWIKNANYIIKFTDKTKLLSDSFA